jgi:hypothetical protein
MVNVEGERSEVKTSFDILIGLISFAIDTSQNVSQIFFRSHATPCPIKEYWNNRILEYRNIPLTFSVKMLSFLAKICPVLPLLLLTARLLVRIGGTYGG